MLSLQRAKAAPLTIRLNLLKLKRNHEFLDFPLPHVQNVTSLSVISASLLSKSCLELSRIFPSQCQTYRRWNLEKSSNPNGVYSKTRSIFRPTRWEFSYCTTSLSPLRSSASKLSWSWLYSIATSISPGHHFGLFGGESLT